MQQITLQYTTTGRLDGSTPAPTFSLDPTSSDFAGNPSENGVYEFDLGSDPLGVLEVPFYGGVADGYRLVSSFWLNGRVAGGAPAALDIYDRNSEAFITRIASLNAQPTLYREGILVPQGTRFVISGFSATATSKVIRYNILVPAVDDDFAALQRASRLYPLA